MTARGVKHSRQRCDYRCGGRHACARAVVCPCPYPPLFVCACTHCRSSVPFPTVVDPCPCIPFHARLRWSPFVPTHLSVALAGPCAYHCSFVLISVRLLVPVCPRPFVSARLCWFPLGCGCPRYQLRLFGFRSRLFVLVYASRLCLYQI